MRGLVLEGGGARGAYQIGACKALKELGVEIHGVVGTSIGALNGAMIAQNELDKAYELWYNMSPSKVFDIDEEKLENIIKYNFSTEIFKYMRDRAKTIFKNRGLDITLIKKIIHDNINETKLRSSKVNFGLVTVSLSEMKYLELFIDDIPDGKIQDYLLASAYLPVFKREKLDGKHFLDGAFYDNLPAKLLINKKYKNLLIIRLNSIGRIRKFDGDNLNITYIEPKEHLGNILNFKTNRIRKNLDLGYYDTLRVLNNLKGKRYYLDFNKKEDYYIKYLMDLTEETLIDICNILGIKEKPSKRLLFEVIIPRLVELLDLDKDSNYEDIIISLFETLANTYKIKKFKIYNFDDFNKEIINMKKNNKIKDNKNIPKFIRNNEILSIAIKENIVREVAYKIIK